MSTVLITAPLDDAALAAARELAPRHRFDYRLDGAIAAHEWADVEALYTGGAVPDPEHAPHLRWVQLYSAGADHVLDRPLFATDTIFTTASGIHGIPIAEHVLGMVLRWFGGHAALDGFQRAHYWPSGREREGRFSTRDLWGMTMGVVGYGSIGRQVARLGAAFGMRILALQRGPDRRDRGFQLPGQGDPEGALPERFYAAGALHDLLAESDIAVVALPLTSATRGLLDAGAFGAMRPDSLFVNIARGAICDEHALVQGLREGRPAAAALDVFTQEPLPADHPFWGMDNVLISPHISGYSAGTQTRAGQVWLENLRRYQEDEPLVNVVSKEHGY